jgi:hypothetical protein
MVWLGALLATAARAEVLVLQDGVAIDGRIIAATGATVTIQHAIGAIQHVARTSIAEVRIPLAAGGTASGALLKWSNRIYQLQAGDEILRVRDGEVLSREAGAPAATAPRAAAAQATRPAAGTYVPPPILIMENGEQVVGRIASIHDGRLELRRATGGMQTLPVSEIAGIVVRGPDGHLTEGEFVGWAAGVHELRVGDRLLKVQDGVVIADTVPPQIGGPLVRTEVETEPAEAPAALEDAATLDLPAAPPPPAGAALEAVGRLLLEVASAPARADDDAVEFTLTLSAPAPQPLVVIYSTLDGTAKAGQDYSSVRGVLTIQPGVERATIRVPVLADRARAGARSFTLFLSSDPRMVDISTNQVIGRIETNRT